MTIRPFITCFGIRRPSETVEKVAVHAVREGYAVVPLRPGRKAPDICTLNSRERKAAGKHECGVHHAITDPTIAGRVFKRLAKDYDAPLNIGVVAWPSRLIVVDADSADACEAFLADWAAAEIDDGYRDHQPTVRTPGAVGADGEWKHKDGGHWYFAVPDGVMLELGRQVIKAPGGYDIRWGWSMTVVPPSNRKEGPYQPVGGDVLDAPAFLVDAILTDTARVAAKRQRNMMVFANDAIASWSLRVDWFDMLVEDGWRDTSKIDSCGCPTFEKPGGGSSTDKSATAHNGECTFYPNFEDHGPLRLWTTDPPPPLDEWLRQGRSPTITKLQYVAFTRYDDDIHAAEVGEGIKPDNSWIAELPEAETEPEIGVPPSQVFSTQLGGTPINPMLELARAELFKAGLPVEYGEKLAKSATDKSVSLLSEAVAQRFLGNTVGQGWEPDQTFADIVADPHTDRTQPGVLVRSDGKMIFSKGDLHNLFGQSEAGKSWLAMLAMKQVLEDGGSCVYVDFEDSALAFYDRMAALGVDLRKTVLEEHRLGWSSPEIEPSQQELSKLLRYDFVVIDSWADMIGTFREGSLRDGILARRVCRLLRMLADNGAAVVVISHGSEKGDMPESSLGASELRQAMTGVEAVLHNVVPFSPTGGGKSLLYVTKDRKGMVGDAVSVKSGVSKAHRRLWGAFSIEPAFDIDDEGRPSWDLVVAKIDPTTHDEQAGQKLTKVEQAMGAILRYLTTDTAEPTKKATEGELKAHLDFTSSTIHRAVEELLRTNLLVVAGTQTPATGGHDVKVYTLREKMEDGDGPATATG